MQVHSLRSQHHDYIVEGLVTGVGFLKDEESLEKIKLFIPQLINSIDADLHRFKFRNVINVLMSFNKIHESDSQIVTKDQLAIIHRMTNRYLFEYLGQSKKDINGSEYANLVDLLGQAERMGYIGVYEGATIE